MNESLAATGPSRAERHGKAATVSRSGGVHEAHDLSDRFGYTWLAAWSRVQLGTLNVAGGQLAEARALLDEALDLSLAIHINHNMALCLVAFALGAACTVRLAVMVCQPGGLFHLGGRGPARELLCQVLAPGPGASSCLPLRGRGCFVLTAPGPVPRVLRVLAVQAADQCSHLEPRPAELARQVAL